MKLHRIALALFLAGGLITVLSAQQAFFGSIVGNVQDPSGQLVPRAAVEIQNEDTGVRLSTKSDAHGAYQALSLNPGTYSVQITAPGFQTFVRHNVVVNGGASARVDAALTLGSTTEKVVVTAATPVLNTENATTTITPITKNLTVSLPNTGSATQVFPDVYNQILNGYADLGNSGYAVGGAVSSQGAEVEDGMRVGGQSDPVGGGRGFVRPGIEAVKEMVVTTSNPSAKYSNPAAIELVTQSGSNQWHGSLSYTQGNRFLNAADYYTHKKSPFLLHQYGASLGGPIHRDKTFFFIAFQGMHFKSVSQSLSSLPTAAMKSGDFSQLLDPTFLAAAGFSTPIVIHDPRTGAPFPNNQIPSNELSSVAQKVMQLYPDPNFDSGKGFYRNYSMITKLVRTEATLDLRVDHYFTPSEHLYGHLTDFSSPNGADQSGIPGFGGNWFRELGKELTIHQSSALTPSFLNDAMFGYFRDHFPGGAGLFDTHATSIPWNQKLGISGIASNLDTGMPYFTFSNSGLTTPVSWGPTNLLEQMFEVRDDATWIHGRHDLDFGVDVRHDRQGSLIPGYGQFNAGSCQFGCMSFTGRWSGFDLADFMLGLPFSSRRYMPPPPDNRLTNEYGFYVQDKINLSEAITLTAGLRYDYFPFTSSEHGLEAIFDPTLNKIVVPSAQSIASIPQGLVLPVPVVTASAAGLPTSLISIPKTNWEPRLSIAYRLRKNTVVRAGAGVYRTPLRSNDQLLLTGPYSIFESFPAVQPPPGGSPVISINNPYSVAGQPRPLLNFFAPDLNLKDDLNYDLDFAVQQQFGATAFTAEYTGKLAVVPWRHQLNAVPASLTPYSQSRLPFPDLGSVQGESNGAHYSYNALRLNASRTFSHGLFFDVTYIHAAVIDDLGGIHADISGNPEDPFNRNRDRGRSYFMPPTVMTINYLWDIPLGRGRFALEPQTAGGIVNHIIRGWEMGATINIQSSPPLTPFGNYLNAAGQNYDAPNAGKFSGRPQLTGESIIASSAQRAAGYYFNPAAFTQQVPAGHYGDAGQGIIPGVGSRAVNFSFFRNFGLASLREGANLRIGLFMFNALNHANTPNPVVNMNSPLFGKLQANKIDQPRTMSLQARIDF